MYPDLYDIERVAPKLVGVPRQNAESIWDSVLLARSFIEQCKGYCHSHGRHHFVLAKTLKAEAEKFIQRPISDYAFAVALLLYSVTMRPHPVNMQQFEKLEIKFPPFNRFEEAREDWNKHQLETLEREIAEGREEFALREKRFGIKPKSDKA